MKKKRKKHTHVYIYIYIYIYTYYFLTVIHESVFAIDKPLSHVDGMEYIFGNHPREFLISIPTSTKNMFYITCPALLMFVH